MTVFAVIITIMVLDLKPAAQATLAALLPLWPTALSYAISYLFIRGSSGGTSHICSWFHCYLLQPPGAVAGRA